MKKLTVFLLFFLFCAQLNAWEVLKTPQFKVFYPEGYEARAEYLLYSLEKYSYIPEKITGNYRSDATFVLEEAGNYMNAYANPVYARMAVFSREYLFEDWMLLAPLHEYTHFLHMTKAGGLPAALSFVMGDLFAPNLLSPLWTDEAVTVYCESAVSPYVGRLNDGTFTSYIAASAAEDRMPPLLKATYRPLETPAYLGPYIYGSAFFKYLAETRGEDKFRIFYEDFGSNVFSYLGGLFPALSFDPAMKNAFGLTTENLWQEWVSHEKQKHAGFKMEGEKITSRGWSHGNTAAFNNRVYYTRSYPEKSGAYDVLYLGELIEYSPADKSEKIIAKTVSGFPQPPKNDGERLFYSVGERGDGYPNRSMRSFGNISVIYEISGEEHREILSADIRDYFPEGGKIYYVSDEPGGYGSYVYAHDEKTGAASEIMKTPYLITEISRYQDMFLIVYKEKGRSQDIALLNPETGERKVIASSPWQEYRASADGSRIFYTANIDGVFRAYCADTETGITYALTQSGYSDGAVFEKQTGDIYYEGISVAGYDIYSKKADFTGIVKARSFEPGHEPVETDADISVEKGSYLDNLASLYPKVRLPAVYAREDGALLAGLYFAGQDAIGDITYSTGIYYDTSGDGVKFDAALNGYMFSPLVFYAAGDNYDNSGGWLGIELPLLSSSRMGLNSITAGVSGRGAVRDSYFSRFWGWAPYINFGISFDRTVWGLGLQQLNKYYYNSNYQDTRHFLSGASGVLYFKQYLGAVNLQVSCRYIEDKDSSNALPKAKAYESAIESDRGWYSQAAISAKLFEVRTGLWNPFNIYIEDVFAKVFAESVSFESQRQLSAGLELTAEVKTLFMADMEIGAYAAFGLEGGFETRLILRSPLVNLTSKKGADIWNSGTSDGF